MRKTITVFSNILRMKAGSTTRASATKLWQFTVKSHVAVLIAAAGAMLCHVSAPSANAATNTFTLSAALLYPPEPKIEDYPDKLTWYRAYLRWLYEVLGGNPNDLPKNGLASEIAAVDAYLNTNGLPSSLTSAELAMLSDGAELVQKYLDEGEFTGATQTELTWIQTLNNDLVAALGGGT